MRLYPAVFWTFLALAMSALPAEAIPSFAREYGLNCMTCHQVSPPRLNSFGRYFQERGYRMPEGAVQHGVERRYRRKDEYLGVLDRLPLALRIKNSVAVRKKVAAGENRAEFNLPLEVHLLSGGALYRNVSYFVNFPIFTNGGVGAPILAYVQLNSLTGSDLLNLRAGKFNVLGFQFTHHRALGFSAPAATGVQVGENPAVLDDHQIGVQLYGRPAEGPFFYEVALVTGVGPQSAGAEAGHAHGGIFSTDLNDFKDIFTRVSYTTPGRMHRFGALGYWGRTSLGVVPGGGDHAAAPEGLLRKQSTFFNGVHTGFEPVNVEDRFRVLGLDADLAFGRLNLRGAIYTVHHDNPFTNGVWVDYQSGVVEASYALSRRLWGMVQYDQVYAKYFKAVERKSLTPHVSYLFLNNARFSVEYHFDLDEADQSRLFLLMDVAM